MESRFRMTSETRGFSWSRPASFSIIDAIVTIWCSVNPSSSALLSISGVNFLRNRRTMTPRISSGVMSFTMMYVSGNRYPSRVFPGIPIRLVREGETAAVRNSDGFASSRVPRVSAISERVDPPGMVT